MVMTMLDTKIISALTKSARCNCYICGCKPSQMNLLAVARNLTIREENLKFGLSTLHAWIKFLECILHIAYKLELQKINTRWATDEQKKNIARWATNEQKKNIASKKTDIQQNLWKTLGVKVDRVVQGRGTSNTGNGARRFFQDPMMASEATGVDQNLISRLGVILQVLSCGHEIENDRFDQYAYQTAELYVRLYDWYPLPPTVHKVLIHGSQTIKYAILPIGRLSEEAQESRNKNYRSFREHHTRKTSRADTTRDLINALLVLSDPVISDCRKLQSAARSELHPEAMELLRSCPSEVAMDTEESSSDPTEMSVDFGRFD